MSLPLGELAKMLVSAVRSIQLIRFSELSSSTIIVYDYLITLDDEFHLIWKASWSAPKALFFINRYYTLFIVLFNNYALFSPKLSDSGWFVWQGWTGLFSCAIAELILQLRLYALYFRSKRVLAAMVTSFILAMAASATIMGMVLSRISSHSNLIPDFPFCVPLNVSHHFYAFWIPILAFETLLCTLAVVRVYETYRTQEMQRGVHLVEVLLRDSVMYYIVMFATYFTITMIWVFASDFMFEVPIGFAVAMSCVMGNRLLLNLRGTGTSNAAGNRGGNAAAYGSELYDAGSRYGYAYGYAYGGSYVGYEHHELSVGHGQDLSKLRCEVMRSAEKKDDGGEGVDKNVKVRDSRAEEVRVEEGAEGKKFGEGSMGSVSVYSTPGDGQERCAVLQASRRGQATPTIDDITSVTRVNASASFGPGIPRAHLSPAPSPRPTLRRPNTSSGPPRTGLNAHFTFDPSQRPTSPPPDSRLFPIRPTSPILSARRKPSKSRHTKRPNSMTMTSASLASMASIASIARSNGSHGAPNEVHYDSSTGAVIGEFEMETLRRLK